MFHRVKKKNEYCRPRSINPSSHFFLMFAFFCRIQINFKIMNNEMKNRFRLFVLALLTEHEMILFSFIAFHEASVSNWLFLFFRHRQMR